MKFYTLLASRYFELRILLDNVKSHKLQLVQFFGIVLVGFFVLHSWFLSVTSWSSGGGGFVPQHPSSCPLIPHPSINTDNFFFNLAMYSSSMVFFTYFNFFFLSKEDSKLGNMP